MCVYVRVWYSRHADEGGVASVQEGAVEHLQDEGQVLEGQVGGGGTQREEEALQRRQKERENGGSQVCLLLRLTWTHTHKWKHLFAIFTTQNMEMRDPSAGFV